MSGRFVGAALLVALSSGCTRLTPRIATVNGREVELATAGTGTPTVVFESGLGSDWSVWDEAAAEVARSSQVFVSSRPGYGRSAAVTTRRDASTIVDELRAVLADQGLPPPYVLVGHSFGGAYLELFARAHPDEVAALVLVESRPVGFTDACEARTLTGCSISPSAASGLPRVQQDELAAFADAAAQVRAAGPLGRYPVRVLTATAHSESGPWESLWQSMHAALAAEAHDGEQILFHGAGHNLEVDRAQDVARIVVETLRSTQNKKAPRG